MTDSADVIPATTCGQASWDDSAFDALPPEWKVCTVGELIETGVIAKPLDGNHGEIHPKGADFVSSGIPFVMATDINRGAD